MPIRGFPDRGVVACFNEPNQSGSIDDWNAPRNAPIRDPLNNIQNVVWHSDFFQYELAAPIATVTINHTSLATRTANIGLPPSINLTVTGNYEQRLHTLYTHNLGYTPLSLVLVDNTSLVSGMRIQYNPDYGGIQRDVSVYADNQIIGLSELVVTGSIDAPAISKTYKVLIFKEPLEDSTAPLFGLNNNNVMSLAHDKVRTDRKYVRQVEDSQSGFLIDLGATVDIKNGRTRIVSGNKVYNDPSYTGNFSGSSFARIDV